MIKDFNSSMHLPAIKVEAVRFKAVSNKDYRVS